MNLFDCEIGKIYKIKAIATSDEELKLKLLSMGFGENMSVCVLDKTLKGATLCVQVGHTQIALRGEEARQIFVF